jgi:hypothetical protein
LNLLGPVDGFWPAIIIIKQQSSALDLTGEDLSSMSSYTEQKIGISFSWLHPSSYTWICNLRRALQKRGGLEKGVTRPCNMSASCWCCGCGCQGCGQSPARILHNTINFRDLPCNKILEDMS